MLQRASVSALKENGGISCTNMPVVERECDFERSVFYAVAIRVTYKRRLPVLDGGNVASQRKTMCKLLDGGSHWRGSSRTV